MNRKKGKNSGKNIEELLLDLEKKYQISGFQSIKEIKQ